MTPLSPRYFFPLSLSAASFGAPTVLSLLYTHTHPHTHTLIQPMTPLSPHYLPPFSLSPSLHLLPLLSPSPPLHLSPLLSLLPCLFPLRCVTWFHAILHRLPFYLFVISCAISLVISFAISLFAQLCCVFWCGTSNGVPLLVRHIQWCPSFGAAHPMVSLFWSLLHVIMRLYLMSLGVSIRSHHCMSLRVSIVSM